MEMRTCCTCKRSLSVDSFYWKNKAKGKRQSYCKDCKKEYNRKWYANPANRANQRRRVSVNNKKYLEAASAWKIAYVAKHGGCSWDGCDIDNPVMIEFDHLDGSDKSGEIANMFRRGCSIKKIEAEAAKCRLLCANHHRLRTAMQFQWEIYAQVSALNS